MLKASLKLKKFQIMELSLVVDSCLKFVSDFNFIKEKAKVGEEKQTGKSMAQRFSLGLESIKSKSEEIDLMCDEDIVLTFPSPMAHKSISENLQQIIEREEEH